MVLPSSIPIALGFWPTAGGISDVWCSEIHRLHGSGISAVRSSAPFHCPWEEGETKSWNAHDFGSHRGDLGVAVRTLFRPLSHTLGDLLWFSRACYIAAASTVAPDVPLLNRPVSSVTATNPSPLPSHL